MINIIIIEDQVLLGNTLKELIEKDEEIKVIGYKTDAKDALDLCSKTKPDIILMDVCTENNSDGIKCAKEIKEVYPDIKIIVMTGMPDISFLKRARQAKVDSFIYKNVSKETFLMTIKSTYNGYSIYPDKTNKNIPTTPLTELNDKEIEILKLYCNGLDRNEIAQELNISINTLKGIISNILLKTNFDNLSKLAIYCISNGYLVTNLK